MLMVVEDHIVTKHTNENKLVECPYCSKDLTTLVYWVHLEEHMNNPSSSPVTPVSKSSTASTASTPEAKQSTPQAEAEAQPISPVDPKSSEKEEVEHSNSLNTEDRPLDVEHVVKENTENVSGSPENCRVTRSGRNIKNQRSQILKNIQEIDKKIALRQREEQMKKLEEENELKQNTETNEISLEKTAGKKLGIVEDKDSKVTSELQLKVEKQIEETILQNDSLNDKIKGPQTDIVIEERPIGEIENTLADVVPKEESLKKKVVPDDSDERHDSKKVGRSREASGDGETGLRRRSISGEKRRSRSSVWNKDQQSSVMKMQGITSVVEPKSKPVLTEEMERNIIYGNFKMKDPANRDDKLVAVKREIENRFKEEEEKRKRLIEEKRKAEEKEREKLRIADERLRKERERLKEEKKKNKQRRKGNKEAEYEEESLAEEVQCEVEAEAEDDKMKKISPAVSRARSRSASPDQYQKIKLEISKMFKENEVETKLKKAKKRHLERDSQSPEHVISKLGRTTGMTERNSGVVSYQVEEEEEEDDELEMMMREFQERHSKSKQDIQPIEKSLPTDSLSLIQSSYRSEQKEEPKRNPPSDSPLQSAVISLSLSCNLCREEEGTSASYKSAYQLLAHVFLSHRKKIVSASRKSREMRLACPENCGFMTLASSEGVSIDYFNSELGGQLSSLCRHIRLHHTGEDSMDHCGECGLPLDFSQTAWQHLANHSDVRRVFCRNCNNFPFKNEKHRCSEVATVVTGVTGLQPHADAVESEPSRERAPAVDWESLAQKVRVDVETFLCESEEKENDSQRYDEEEDKVALLDMFIELALIDEEASKIQTFLEIGINNYRVETDLHYTKSGKVKLLASVKIDEERFEEFGDSEKETFDNLVARVRRQVK